MLKNNLFFILLFISIISCSFSYALQIGYDDDNQIKVVLGNFQQGDSITGFCPYGYVIQNITLNGIQCVPGNATVIIPAEVDPYYFSNPLNYYNSSTLVVPPTNWTNVTANYLKLDQTTPQTITGNLTVTNTGFFGWIGSLLSPITKIWTSAIDINAGNITNVSYIRLNKITSICDLTINGTICSNSSGTYIVG